VPSVWPNYHRYRGQDGTGFARHAGTVWPQIQGMWALAAASQGDAAKFGHEFFQLAGHAVRDRQFAELYHPLTGAIYGGWQERNGQMVLWESKPRQSWAATAYLAMVLRGLVGIEPTTEGIRISPCVPEGLHEVKLSNVRIRSTRLDLTVRGTGTKVQRLEVNGRERSPASVLAWNELGSGPVIIAVTMARL